MIREYSFSGEHTLLFDDSKSVKELIQYAFEKYGYYEPLGMDIVTIFQGHHPAGNYGWFTTDTSLSCAEEIKSPTDLFFAYHMPDVFFFSEGGWGHHMSNLGNHPSLEDPVSLKIRFDDFCNTVVICGKYSFQDIINTLKSAEYIPNTANHLIIRAINPYHEPYRISFDDPIMTTDLVTFAKSLPNSVVIIDID